MGQNLSRNMQGYENRDELQPSSLASLHSIISSQRPQLLLRKMRLKELGHLVQDFPRNSGLFFFIIFIYFIACFGAKDGTQHNACYTRNLPE